MRVEREASLVQKTSLEWRKRGENISFVPTMGALHKGHLSLVEKAGRGSSRLIVSIFVNPLQFGPKEDYSKYPRDEDGDLDLLKEAGVDLVYIPEKEGLFPPGFETRVVPGPVADPLEGAFRPGHFSGVATIVLKLFSIALPDSAWFGAKDAQQLALIRQMVRDFNLPIAIKAGPIVRDTDGLAMSSRNRFLSKDERRDALSLFRGLSAAKRAHLKGERRSELLINMAEKEMRGDSLRLEYLELRHPLSFSSLTDPIEEGLLLVSARVGETRLIDNMPLGIATEELCGLGD